MTTTEKPTTKYQPGCLTAWRKQRDKLYAELMAEDDISGDQLHVKAIERAMIGEFALLTDRFQAEECCPECGQTIEDREWINRAVERFHSVCKKIKEAEHAIYLEAMTR